MHAYAVFQTHSSLQVLQLPQYKAEFQQSRGTCVQAGLASVSVRFCSRQVPLYPYSKTPPTRDALPVTRRGTMTIQHPGYYASFVSTSLLPEYIMSVSPGGTASRPPRIMDQHCSPGFRRYHGGHFTRCGTGPLPGSVVIGWQMVHPDTPSTHTTMRRGLLT